MGGFLYFAHPETIQGGAAADFDAAFLDIFIAVFLMPL
jgi:hypothetical protein